MSTVIDVQTYLEAEPLPTIDVRSPAEFARGHIPGAHNVPLFDDAQRAEVGTIYKQTGRLEAVIRGMEIAGANAERIVAAVKDIAIDQDLYLHCWRGGMRSEGAGWLLNKCQFRTRVLRGGYKSFRQAAHECFDRPRRIVILGGLTGSGKTELLRTLHDQGEQIVDLEQLANHRGSAFGGIGQPPQPTVEQFENELFFQWRLLDPSKPVWMEGESKSIGRVYIPQGVWDQMLQAPEVIVDVDRPQRVEFLVQQYGDAPHGQLAEAIGKIKKRLGGDRYQAALKALNAGDIQAVTNLALEYYDKAYSNGTARHPRDRITRVRLTKSGAEETTGQLQRLGHELLGDPVKLPH